MLAAAGLGAALLAGGGARHELGGDLGLVPEAAFGVRLAGGLYAARTLRDADGVPDVAYLTADVPLTVRADARSADGVARITVLVDGDPAGARRSRCPRERCPPRFVARLTPRMARRAAGAHLVEVRVTGPGSRPATQRRRFTVRVGRAGPAPAEIEAATTPHGGPIRLDRPERGVDRLVAAAARREPLAALLGPSRLHLRERGRGARTVTVLADVVPARRNVSVTLPQPGDEGPARMRASTLRDVIVDVDRRRRTVVAVQPGPASTVTAWTPAVEPPSESPDDAPSVAFSAARPPRLRTLSDRGPAFFTEDGDPTLRPDGRDWPVSIVFTGRATVPKVKAALRTVGLVRRGHTRYLGYRLPGSGLLRFDGDRGLKATCDAAATDVHIRVYAPSATDRFADPELGSVVLGTVHLDHVDGCGTGPSLFGFSERAEARVATLVARRLGWKVARDALAVGNAEPLRRDAADPGHVWLADGAATQITVP